MPLAHVYLGGRLLILASGGMKNSLALLFLDDHCSTSLCLSEYLAGGRGTSDFPSHHRVCGLQVGLLRSQARRAAPCLT